MTMLMNLLTVEVFYRYFAIRGDCIYTSSDMLYVYGIPWEYVELAGDELGVRNGNNEPPVYEVDDLSISTF